MTSDRTGALARPRTPGACGVRATASALAAILFFAVPATAAPVAAGYWKFDESSGTVAANSGTGGSAYNGTLNNFATGSAPWIPGRFGNALAYADQNDVVLLDNVLDIGAEWTVAAWFLGPLPDTGSRWHTLTRGTDDHQLLLAPDSDELGWYDNAGGTRFHGTGYSLAGVGPGWHHIASVGTGGNTYFYLDGVFVGSATGQSSSNIYMIGNIAGGGQRFADAIDDLAVWNQALSAATIAQLAAGEINPLGEPLGVPEPGVASLAIATLLAVTALAGRSRWRISDPVRR